MKYFIVLCSYFFHDEKKDKKSKAMPTNLSPTVQILAFFLLLAAVLKVKLSEIATWSNARKQARNWYAINLEGLKELIVKENSKHVFYFYFLRSPVSNQLKQQLQKMKLDAQFTILSLCCIILLSLQRS